MMKSLIQCNFLALHPFSSYHISKGKTCDRQNSNFDSQQDESMLLEDKVSSLKKKKILL